VVLNATGNSWGIECGSSAKNSNALTFVLDYGGTNSEKMRIDSSGNVMIGGTTVYSSSKLTINNSAVSMLGYQTSSTGYTGFRIYNDQLSSLRALEIDYSGSAYSGSLIALGPSGEAAVITTTGAYPLVFGTNNTSRMMIDSSGNVGINTASPSPYKLKVSDGRVFFQNDSAGDPNLYISNGSYAGTFIYFYSFSGFTGAITYSANVTSYTSASDYRMKNVIGAVSDSGARIDALKPIDFEWKSNNLKARGFLAHEFQEVYPSSVTGTKDGTKEEEYEVTPAVEATEDADGVELTPAEPKVMGTRTVPDYQAMQASTSEVIADLVAELQSLRKRIATLESK
jgi:hypothetical protein